MIKITKKVTKFLVSKTLPTQEKIDFRLEDSTKKYHGKLIRPKINSWMTRQDFTKTCLKLSKPVNDRLQFPDRNADWTNSKQLYQGQEKDHSAVFMVNKPTGKRINYGYNNNLLLFPMNDRGYVTDGTIWK